MHDGPWHKVDSHDASSLSAYATMMERWLFVSKHHSSGFFAYSIFHFGSSHMASISLGETPAMIQLNSKKIQNTFISHNWIAIWNQPREYKFQEILGAAASGHDCHMCRLAMSCFETSVSICPHAKSPRIADYPCRYPIDRAWSLSDGLREEKCPTLPERKNVLIGVFESLES